MKLPVQELNREHLMRAIDQEMTARGLTKSDNPDVLVDLQAKVEKKQDTSPITDYDDATSWAWEYEAGFEAPPLNVYEYEEGTLFINVVDAKLEKIVWQGIGRGTLNEGNISPERREENINKAVNKIFGNYPVEAAPNS